MAPRAMRWEAAPRRATWRDGQHGHSEIPYAKSSLNPRIHHVNKKMKHKKMKQRKCSCGFRFH